MSKYRKLTFHLADMNLENWQTTFNEVEEVIGMPLPASARQYPAWWANQGRGQSLAWQGAGWQTASVDVENERVTFMYVGDRPEQDNALVNPLTISDAKVGLAAMFGVSPEAVEITIRA